MKEIKAKMLTSWGMPTEKIKSGYGKITYYDWCKLEQARWFAKGVRVEVKPKPRTGEIALFRTLLWEVK